MPLVALHFCRIVWLVRTPEPLSEDEQVEPSLRPTRLSEFIGQGKVCEALSIAIEAAKLRKDALDHVLFHDPPGLGKTTLATLLAREMGVNIKTTSGTVLEKPADLVGILTNQREGDILFIDEIHRLRPIIEEFLYPAMEDWQLATTMAVKDTDKRGFGDFEATDWEELVDHPFSFGPLRRVRFAGSLASCASDSV